jgi:hypothetical protein
LWGKKNEKKDLTTFSENGIGNQLKESNLFVIFVHNLTGKGGG